MKTNKKNINLHWLTLYLGFAQIYAWATTYYLPAALIEIVARETKHSSLVIMGGFSWGLLIGGVFSPKIGAWIERNGGRYPLCLGTIFIGLGLLLLSKTDGLIIWYAAWTILGFGMALGLFNAVFASMGRLLGQKSKTIIIRITLISGFATLFWPITTHLIQSVGWKKMLVYYSIPYFVLWAPLYFYSIPKGVPEHAKIDTEKSLVVTDKVKLILYLFTIYAILRAIVGTIISVDIITLFIGIGLSIGSAALVAALIGPSQIVGRILELSLGSRFDPLKSSIFWTAILPLAILLLIVFGSSTVIVFAIAYGMSNGVLTITMGILPMILFGSKGYAELLGKIAFPVLVSQAIAPLVVAPLLDYWPTINIFIVAGLLGISALICLIVLATIILKRTDSE